MDFIAVTFIRVHSEYVLLSRNELNGFTGETPDADLGP